MKANRLVLSIVLMSFATLLSAEKGQFNYIGALSVSKASSERAWVSDLGMGLGTYHMLDYQPLSFMAIGLGFGYASYSADGGSMTTDCLDVAGRLLPVAERDGQSVRPYLVGGMGVRPLWKSMDEAWPGNYHGFAGAGLKYDFDRKPGGSGLDVQAVYEFYTPVKSNLNTMGLRVAYSVAFGKSKGSSSAAAPRKAEAAAPAALKYKNYTVQSGDTLRSIACKQGVYGDCDLYPLLVAANRDQLKSPVLTPGMNLRVVVDVPEDKKAQARRLATEPAWAAWSGARKVEEAKLPAYAGLVPTPTPGASVIDMSKAEGAPAAQTMDYVVKEGDTLWKIACRKEVYGDCELYPLIVATNRETLKSPELTPGMTLKIVKNPSPASQEKARAAAWDPKWAAWRGTQVTKERYMEWKKKQSTQ